MSARRLINLAPVLALALIAALPIYGAKLKSTAPKIDPQAVAMLRGMGDYLQGLQSFSVHVDTSRDVLSPSNQALTSDQSFDLAMQRPDRFRISMMSAAGQAQVFYDGKTVTIFTPKRNYYATIPAASTIRETLKGIARRGIEMPLATLLQREPGQSITANIVSGLFVGSSMVNGVNTNQLAFRGKQVDWQIWIQDDPSAPLPVKVVIVDRRVNGKPRYTAYLSNWNTNPTFDTNMFTFTPPAGAQKIGFSQLPKQPRTFTRGTKRALMK
jgi:hypothetical protein